MERSRTGHQAGFRTTLLVTLAAAVAMIQVNLLIATNGKPSDSYAVMDLMRLPLGILTGVGFIGAGAIVRKDELVLGITTAATLWFATVVGLCMGGGQKVFGSAATIIGFIVLWGFRGLERRFERYQHATLKITVDGEQLTEGRLREVLALSGLRIKAISVSSYKTDHRRRYDYDLRWSSGGEKGAVPQAISEIESLPEVTATEWSAWDTGPQ